MVNLFRLLKEFPKINNANLSLLYINFNMNLIFFTSIIILFLSAVTASFLGVIVLNHLDDLKLKGYSGYGYKYKKYKQIGGAVHFVTAIVTLFFLHFVGFLNALHYLTFVGFALLYVVLGFYDFRLNHYKYVQISLLVLLSFFVVYFHKNHFFDYHWGIAVLDSSPFLVIALFTGIIVGIISLLIVIDNLYKQVVPILALIIVVLFCFLDAKNTIEFFYFNLSVVATLCVVIYFELFGDRTLFFGKGGIYLLGFYFAIYFFHLLS